MEWRGSWRLRGLLGFLGCLRRAGPRRALGNARRTGGMGRAAQRVNRG